MNSSNMSTHKRYISPQAAWSELEAWSLVCDSFDSGIDDYDYIDINLNN